MTRSSLLLTLLLAAPAFAARKAEVPPPADLLALALHPTASYRGRGRVQLFPAAGKPRSQHIRVEAAPGGRYHKAFAPSLKKAAALVQCSDGKTVSLLHVRSGTHWKGPAPDDAAEHSRRLSELYELAASTGSPVARRSTWRLDFRDRAGVLRRAWWLDRRTGAVLRREQFRADGSLERRERLSRFEEAALEDSVFAPPSAPARPWAEPGAPRWRPEGFVPLESRRDGARRVLGYGDGHASLTLVSAPGTAPRGRPAVEHGPEGLRVSWACGTRVCRLAGDVPEDELLRAAASVEPLP